MEPAPNAGSETLRAYSINLFHNAAIIVPDPAKDAYVGASREFSPENRSFGSALGGSQCKEVSGVYTSR